MKSDFKRHQVGYNLFNLFSSSFILTLIFVVLGGEILIMLAVGRKVRRLKPAREQWIFKDDKSPYHDFILGEA
jgi:hypothetical protein